MIDCIAPDWLFNVWSWLTDRELIILINWLMDKGIVSCNEVI